ncbi:MAG: peptide chain release factor N(5)-glutamine methyltransferase [Candidatus Parcubacteria bacterium]|nr:peptide chain release factor N(5)-glutamine methyltransferase [Leptolyngbyaceae cyanobacterium LF-bin-113]
MTCEISGLNLWQWRQEAQASAIDAAILPSEVDWLLQELAGLDRLSLRLESFKYQSRIKLKIPFLELKQRWQQRIDQRVPIQYLAGSTPWRTFTLSVSPAVLIPRPETEELIDLAIAATILNPALKTGDWADLGTGSGAIAMGLADVFPNAIIHAVDCSSEALAIAQQNAQNLGFGDRVQFYQGTWLEPLESLKGKLSGLVSNPPYIPSQMVRELQPEVTNHEPHLALNGGSDGLDCIRHLVTMAPNYLRIGGVWMVEMMAGQADAVTRLLTDQGSYGKIQIHRDLAGVERFATAIVLQS